MDARRSMVNGLLEIAGQAGPNGTLVELDYLESSGVQWIDTKVNCGADVDWSVDIVRYASSTWSTPIGGRKEAGGNNYGNGVMYGTGGNLQYNYGNLVSNGTLPVNERHVLSMTGNAAYYDGVQKGTVNFTGESFSYANPIYLGVMNQNSGLVYPFKGKMYAASITKSGVMLRDFVPMLRLEDSKPGMYDKVSKKFFTNIGIGDDFSYYPLLPEGYRRAEWLSPTGGARLDTLVPGGNDNLKIVSRLKYTAYVKYKSLYTAYESEAANSTRIIMNSSDNGSVLSYINNKAGGGGTSVVLSKGAWHDVIHTKSKVTVDGVVTNCSNVPGNALSATIKIVSADTDVAMVFFSRLRIYDDNVLIRDYIPCVRMSDSTPGLYDVCGSISPTTDSPFYINNKETGSFAYSPLV